VKSKSYIIRDRPSFVNQRETKAKAKDRDNIGDTLDPPSLRRPILPRDSPRFLQLVKKRLKAARRPFFLSLSSSVLALSRFSCRSLRCLVSSALLEDALGVDDS